MGVRRRSWRSGLWKGTDGTPDIGAASASRDNIAMLAGNATDANTGPYTVSSFTQANPSSGNVITISTPGTYYGVEYWGQVKVTVAGVVFRECAFRGPDPTTVGAHIGVTDLMGCISHYGSNKPMVELYDCIIDPEPWVTVKGKDKLDPYVLGWHGGQARIRRTEIKNIQDGVGHIGPSSTTPSVYLAQEFLMELCWIHKGYYVNNFYDQRVNDGQPHNDGFQTNYGRNVTLRACTIGGIRSSTGYLTWPNCPPAIGTNGAGYNSGDDMWNSAILLNQEVGNDDSKRYENVLIEQCLIGGGKSSLNHTSRTSYPNTWSTTTVRDCKFLQRATSWGYNLRGDGQDQVPYRNDINAATSYIFRGTNVAATYSNLTIYETGTATPVSNGGIQG